MVDMFKLRRTVISIALFLLAIEIIAVSLPQIDLLKKFIGYGLTSTIFTSIPLLTPGVFFAILLVYVSYRILKGRLI